MIEISKGSKVKYELDKKTGLIKVIKAATINLCKTYIQTVFRISLDIYADFLKFAYAGRSCSILISSVPP